MNPDAVDAVDRVPHGGDTDPDVLDFSANTNPVRPAGVTAAFDASLAAARRYPDDEFAGVREAAGDYVGCAPESVIPTAGGLAGLRLTVATHVAAGDRVLLPAPSFGEYAREVRLQGGDPTFVPHDEVVDADPAGYAVAVVCTPNNPTGDAVDDDLLRAFAARCRDADTLLLVDEAFADFTDRPSLAGEPGVVVARSLTKVFGLPGIRAGFLVARGRHLDRLETARPAWGLSTPAAAVAERCLRCEGFVRETRARVRRERARVATALADRYDVNPSDAPFLLLGVGDRDVDDVVAHARERGVAIRDARTFRGLDAHVRVAIKRPPENDRLLEALP